MNKNNQINIFYACDNNFIKYAIVSVNSLIKNSSKKYNYSITFLHTDITEKMQNSLKNLQTDNVKISFENVKEQINGLEKFLPIRDYYTKTTYFRLFIANMFPDLNKALYIDSDTVILGDVSELFNHDIGDNLVGACHEQVMLQVNEYGKYVEEVCGIDRRAYFNAGVLLINCKLFREKNVLTKFTHLLQVYNFKVTQDEDYLNVLCRDRVYWLNDGYNTEVFGEIKPKKEDIKILHYIMTSKPWKYKECRYGAYFWKYAKDTEFYSVMLQEIDNFTEEDKRKDNESCKKLLELAIFETNREDGYYKTIKKSRSKDREEVLFRIYDMACRGVFDVDPEDDPPTLQLLPEKIDYLRKKPISKIKRNVSFFVAKKFVKKLLKSKQMIIKDVLGIENWANLKSGAIITCNHFNPFDSFAVQLAFNKTKNNQNRFYRVIREGNYTSFPGLYGFFMRNCNTLPLSSNLNTMKKFLSSVDKLLQKGNFILVYPEQAMWWNYRKPRPTKIGAFKFASKNNVPVLPIFITMRDSDVVDSNGYYVQEYTVHISKPIYPSEKLSVIENTEYLKSENDKVWKEIYEKTYMLKLGE